MTVTRHTITTVERFTVKYYAILRVDHYHHHGRVIIATMMLYYRVYEITLRYERLLPIWVPVIARKSIKTPSRVGIALSLFSHRSRFCSITMGIE